MMNILNKEKYEKQLKDMEIGKHYWIYELWLPILLFGSIGAITWAIRGTAGWGGVDGTILPGMMWGVLWYYLAYRKGIDARGIVLWLGLGISLGGELGYGQYVGWIRGIFSVGEETITIEPWLGYFWLIICGIGWAAPGGILLGWSLGKPVSTGTWVIRSIMLIPLLLVLFAWPVVDWLGVLLLKTNSSILFPNYYLGLYTGDLDSHLSRTVYTNTQNMAVVVWWVAALILALWQKDRTTIITGLIIGGGFGLGFMQSTLWTLGYGIDPNYIDWWKIWELNAGFNLGLLYAVTLYWAIRQVDENAQTSNKIIRSKLIEWRETLFLAIGGFILLFFVGFEYFFWPGLILSLWYFISMCLTTRNISNSLHLAERRKNISLAFSVFFLVYLMFHGGSERLGIILGLYNENAVSQYSWPIERIYLFIPVVLVIASVALYKMWRILSPKEIGNHKIKMPSNKSVLITDLMTVMGFIGALSIWPAKIGVLYALFLVFAIWSFNRLEQQFNMVDNQK
jgi:hypothetical protein